MTRLSFRLLLPAVNDHSGGIDDARFRAESGPMSYSHGGIQGQRAVLRSTDKMASRTPDPSWSRADVLGLTPPDGFRDARRCSSSRYSLTHDHGTNLRAFRQPTARLRREGRRPSAGTTTYLIGNMGQLYEKHQSSAQHPPRFSPLVAFVLRSTAADVTGQSPNLLANRATDGYLTQWANKPSRSLPRC